MQQPKPVPAVKEPKPVPAVKESKPVPAVKVDPVIDNSVVVIGSQLLATNPVHLIINFNLRNLTKGNFDITDVNGTDMFSIKGKLLSLHDHRMLLDAAGNSLITLQQKRFSSRWKIFRGDSTDDNDLLFTAKKTKMPRSKTGLSVFIAGNTKEDVADFKVQGSNDKSSGLSAAIYLGESNTIIAQINTQYSGALSRVSFAVTVYPNVDYAFIVALVVVLEDINRDQEMSEIRGF